VAGTGGRRLLAARHGLDRTLHFNSATRRSQQSGNQKKALFFRSLTDIQLDVNFHSAM
jgi:hypothetical protein